MSQNEDSMSDDQQLDQSLESLEKKFNCIKCSVRLKDVKLLKLHFWKVHISKNEIQKAKNEYENLKNNNKSLETINETSPKKLNGTHSPSIDDSTTVIATKTITNTTSTAIINNNNTATAKTPQRINSASKRTSTQTRPKSEPKKRKLSTNSNESGSLKKVNRKKKLNTSTAIDLDLKTDSDSQMDGSNTEELNESIDDHDDDDHDDHDDGSGGSDDQDEDDEKSENISNEKSHEDENDYSKLLDKLDNLTSEEIKTFNLCKDIDESALIEKFKLKNQQKPYNKLKELKSGCIVWAAWRSRGKTLMWPSKVEKIIKDKSYRVYIRYYELSCKVGNVFKLDPTKVELFYRSVDDHLSYKALVTEYKPQRYEFFMTYTKALEDFVKWCEENEKEDNDQSSSSSSSSSSAAAAAVAVGLTATEGDDLETKLENTKLLKKHEDKATTSSTSKYLVNGKMLALSEITELASKKLSDEQLKANQERADYSKKLLDLLLSDKCKDFIISILNESFECRRHSAYLKADFHTRKTMKFCSPGPLIDDHQKQLAEQLLDLSKTHFVKKPIKFTSYEYDVLYPEAVIWGLMKQEGLTYRKAEIKYKAGFKRSLEEQIKQRCNEILNKLPKKLTNQNGGTGLAGVGGDSVDNGNSEDKENSILINLDSEETNQGQENQTKNDENSTKNDEIENQNIEKEKSKTNKNILENNINKENNENRKKIEPIGVSADDKQEKAEKAEEAEEEEDDELNNSKSPNRKDELENEQNEEDEAEPSNKDDADKSNVDATANTNSTTTNNNDNNNNKSDQDISLNSDNNDLANSNNDEKQQA